MNNKKYLDKNDYDFYTIDLGKIPPFTSSKAIEKKLFANLEKLHPCFSDYCTFDYVLKSEKIKTIAKVVVVDSMFLIEYKNSHNTNYIKIEEFNNKKLFLSKKQKKIKTTIYISLFFLLLASFITFMAKNYLEQKKALENIPRIIEHAEEKQIFDISNFIDFCLPVFADPSIKVSYFEYTASTLPQITLHTKGIQREEIEDNFLNIYKDLKLNFSATTYSENTPNLSVTINCDKQPIKNAAFCDIQNSFIEIRNSIFSVHGLPISEAIETRQYQCIVPYNGLQKFFEDLLEIQEVQKIKFEKIVFDYNQEIGNLNCIIVLDKLKSEKALDFSNFILTFKKPIERPKEKTVSSKKQETITKEDRVLVGKMPAADGSMILYYRTSEGKIIYEKE